MNIPGRAWAEGIGLALLMTALFVFPEPCAQAARHGITLSVELLIPSLFPFFVLSSLCISTGLAARLARLLEPLMSLLFGVSGGGASALILGAVGGYPTGARTLAQLVQNQACSPREAQRLALFCNNCGPAFFIGAVGVGIFGSKKAGFLLLGTHLLAAVLIGVALRITQGPLCGSGPLSEPPSYRPLFAALPDCVRTAFSSVLGVCSYVLLFSVLSALAQCSGLLPAFLRVLTQLLPGEHTAALCQSFVMGCLELSTGTAALKHAAASPAALPIAAFILGWGGLSVHCQSLPFWQKAGINYPAYLKAKWVQGLLAAGLTALFSAFLPLSLPAMAPLVRPPVSSLWHREIVALWALSGLSFCLFKPKRLPSTDPCAYNK